MGKLICSVKRLRNVYHEKDAPDPVAKEGMKACGSLWGGAAVGRGRVIRLENI